MECPSCRSAVDDDARFCSSCGHEMTRRHDERRVVTVLFADIVGFTALSESRDPEQVKNLVDRCFALLADDITAFGGRVDKVVGDAIIALFGAPIAHEDDAERAVRAALRMQETVGRYDRESAIGIQVRIGVNTGEVLVGAIAAGDDYTAMGDVVNTASRLQTAADPGTVLVGPITHSATDEVIHYRSIGQLHARGREQPVSTYRALEPVGQAGERKTASTTPLIGREPELDVLRQAVAAAYRRSRAQLIVVAGESGVGKSRLAAEVAEVARLDHDAVVLHGRCLPYGEANVWWPIAEAIRKALGLDADIDEADVPAAVSEAIRRAAPEVDESLVARTTDGLSHLFGYESGLGRLDPERAAEEATRAARFVLHSLATCSPVVLWLSDLDCADAGVLNLLDDILERLGRLPVIVLVTGRVSLFEKWAPKHGRFNSITISLEPLDERDAESLARELLPDGTAEEWHEIAERSGGNPLFLEEMARMVRTADAGVERLPANVRSVISARLDALDADALHVIEDAAVLGPRGVVMALERMAEIEREEMEIGEALRALERADLLEVLGSVWTFRSNLVRDVVYSRLTKTDRAFRHAGIAAWIDANKVGGGADTIAYHYRQAAAHAAELGGVEGLPPDLDEKAVSWTLDAARNKSRETGLERAGELFTVALDLMADDDPRRADILLERAGTALKMLRVDSARVDLDLAAPLVSEAGDPWLQFRLDLLESEIAQWSGDQDKALERAAAALATAEMGGDATFLADALRRAGMVHLFRGEHAQAELSINAAYEAYDAAGDANGMAWARQNLAWISFVSGRMVEAEERLTQAIESFHELGDLSGKAWSRGLLAYVRIHAGRFAEAEELALQTLVEVKERGDRWGQGMMNLAIATVALWTGRIDEAIQRAGQARSLFPLGSDPIGHTQSIAIEGRALVRSGRVTEGFRILDEALAVSPVEPALSMLETTIAAAAATVGDAEHGHGVLGEIAGFDPEILGESDRAVATALIHLQAGDPGEAKRLVDVMPDPATGDGSTWGWAVLALVAGAVGDDIDRFVANVETASRSTYADQTIARCATACAAARVGDEAGARVALQRAYDAVPSGGDRVHPTIVAVAESVCLSALGTDDAEAVTTRAEKATAAIGIDDRGWRTVFMLACGLDPPA